MVKNDNAVMANTTRAHWADVLKFIGMILIFWGHLLPVNSCYAAVYAHHVPLFFFASGLFATLTIKEISFGKFVWKKVRSLLFPYFFFSLLTIIIFLIFGKLKIANLGTALLDMIKGIRNTTPGVQLWFFPCLFIVAILFELIKRIFKNKYLISIICIALFVIGITCLGHEPTQDPLWIWNLDSALVYILYYMIGAWVFPVINNFSYREKSSGKKVCFWICFILALFYTAFMYFAGDCFALTLTNLLSAPLFEIFAMLTALIMIFTAVCFSKMLQNVRIFSYIGEGSLYLCGNEIILDYLVGFAINALNLKSFIHANWWASLLYSIILIFICTFTLNIIEKKTIGKIF